MIDNWIDNCSIDKVEPNKIYDCLEWAKTSDSVVLTGSSLVQKALDELPNVTLYNYKPEDIDLLIRRASIPDNFISSLLCFDESSRYKECGLLSIKLPTADVSYNGIKTTGIGTAYNMLIINDSLDWEKWLMATTMFKDHIRKGDLLSKFTGPPSATFREKSADPRLKPYRIAYFEAIRDIMS